MTDLPTSRGVKRDFVFDSSFSRVRDVIPKVDITQKSVLPDGQLVLNKADGAVYYSSALEWHKVQEDLNTNLKLVISHGDNNFQTTGFGGGNPTNAYFGTQLGPVSGDSQSASIIPFTNILNISGFVEDITSSAGGPNYAQGAPGWRVPIDGVYRVAAKINVSANIDQTTNPASLGYVGQSRPFNGSLALAINNSGVVVTTLNTASKVWSALPVAEDSIAMSVEGFTYVSLLTTDVLYVGLTVNNVNNAMSFGNGSMEIQFVQ